MRKSLPEFKYMTFDVVGTLIDFEGGLKDCLAGIATEAGVTIDGEEALNLYRAARYSKDADLFPDDLVRVYLEIAPKLACQPNRNTENVSGTPRRHGKVSPTAPRRWRALPKVAGSSR